MPQYAGLYFLGACCVASAVLILGALVILGMAAGKTQRLVKHVKTSADSLQVERFQARVEQFQATAVRAQAVVARAKAAVAEIQAGIQDLRSQFSF